MEIRISLVQRALSSRQNVFWVLCSIVHSGFRAAKCQSFQHWKEFRTPSGGCYICSISSTPAIFCLHKKKCNAGKLKQTANSAECIQLPYLRSLFILLGWKCNFPAWKSLTQTECMCRVLLTFQKVKEPTFLNPRTLEYLFTNTSQICFIYPKPFNIPDGPCA